MTIPQRVVVVQKGGFRLNNATGQFVQNVTLTNAGSTAITGPASLVLMGLSTNAALFNKTGTTSCSSPAGNPFIDLGIQTSLAAGKSVTATLHLQTRPTQESSTTHGFWRGVPIDNDCHADLPTRPAHRSPIRCLADRYRQCLLARDNELSGRFYAGHSEFSGLSLSEKRGAGSLAGGYGGTVHRRNRKK